MKEPNLPPQPSSGIDGNNALDQRPKRTVPRPEPGAQARAAARRRMPLSALPVAETTGVRNIPHLEPRSEEPAEEAIADEDIEVVDAPEEVEAADVREPGELQEADVVAVFEIKGFSGIQVAATLEKKNTRKGKTAEKNEDNIIADPDTGLIGVLDGLGGEGAEGAGAKASAAAEAAIPESYALALAEAKKQNIGEIAERIVERQLARLNIADPEKRLEKQRELAAQFEGVIAQDPEMGRKAAALLESIRSANKAVLETGDEKTRGKTTACVGMIHRGPDGKSYAIVASIGDSIAFKRRINGEMVPMTKEDSLLNIMTESGTITPALLAEMKADHEQFKLDVAAFERKKSADPNTSEKKPKAKKYPFKISLELIQALGGDQSAYEGFVSRGTTELPLDYGTLKRSMSRSMGADTAEAALTIREMKQGDELIFATDVFDNFENTQTEEMDLDRIAQVAGNAGSQTERLARLREAAKQGPKDDDAALVSARVL